MNRKRKTELSPKILMVGLMAICILLLSVSAFYKDSAKPFRVVAGAVIVPMQKGINQVGVWVVDRFEHFENINDLQKKNDDLEAKVSELQAEVKNLQQDKYELDNLRELYALDKKHSEYPKVAARIISGGSGNWFNTFVIDKGAKDGLAVDMNVIAGNGLVGIITEVGPNYARVRSIIDDTSSVSAMFTRTSDFCTVSGSQKQIENGYIDVVNINKDAKVQDGDELVTSSISPKFLPGLTIGYVSDVTMESSNLVQTAKVTPVVDFRHLREVLIITELKQAVE